MSANRNLPPWADAAASKRLPELCAKGEGQGVEFKQCVPPQGHDIAKSIAAFASSNTGVILYGVSNDGSIVGLTDGHDSKVRDQISLRVLGAAKEIRPSVHPTVTWACYGDKAVCVVQVDRGLDALYYSNQRAIVRRGSTSRPAEPSEVEHAFRLRYSSGPASMPLPSTRQIAERMNTVLHKMNKDRREPLTVSDLALAMGLGSPADLELVLMGHTPPTFELLDHFCSRFAVSKEWLTTGRSSPFSSQIEHRPEPEDYLSVIDEAECEAVYAVRSRSDVGESFLVIESDTFKFWLLPDVWHVSDHVGGGGARDLASLYALFSLWANSDRSYVVRGRHIEPALAESIWNGQTFPGVVADLPLSHWWDDLTDLDHRWTKREAVLKSYGRQFVAAQDIVREVLSRRSGASSKSD